jgi:hypothetical protein
MANHDATINSASLNRDPSMAFPLDEPQTLVMLNADSLDADRSMPFTRLVEPEPRPVLVPVISVDDHLVEPPSVFEGRLPAGLVEIGPRMVTNEEGVPYWSSRTPASPCDCSTSPRPIRLAN